MKARDIAPDTRRHLSSRLLDGHANLYLHFIEKCVRHLNPGGLLAVEIGRNRTALEAAFPDLEFTWPEIEGLDDGLGEDRDEDAESMVFVLYREQLL